MARVTSKLQVTIPKAVADRHAIRPGQEIEFREEAGGTLRVVVERARERERSPSPEERLALFDSATKRIRRITKEIARDERASRGWTREELYDRDLNR